MINFLSVYVCITSLMDLSAQNIAIKSPIYLIFCGMIAKIIFDENKRQMNQENSWKIAFMSVPTLIQIWHTLSENLFFFNFQHLISPYQSWSSLAYGTWPIFKIDFSHKRKQQNKKIIFGLNPELLRKEFLTCPKFMDKEPNEWTKKVTKT